MISLGIDVPGKYTGAYAVYNSAEDRVLIYEPITFDQAQSERNQYRQFGRLLNRLHGTWRFGLVVIEHPFLHIIAQHIGAVKMWVALTPGNVGWYMLTASSARKIVFGDAKKITRTTKTGTVVSAAKEFVHAQMLARYGRVKMSQHEADAILYAVAGAIKSSQSEE